MAKDKLKALRASRRISPTSPKSPTLGWTARFPKASGAERFDTPAPRLTLELACGKGEYTLAQARLHPERHFVGVDIKGARIWDGAGAALREPLTNVHFLRVWIDHLPLYFAPGSLEEIWIVFPDPYLREKQASKRLTSPKFARIYASLLRPGAAVHLKTDSPELTDFTLEQVREGWFDCACHIPDIYAGGDAGRSDTGAFSVPDVLTSVQTFYERSHLRKGRTIRYLHLTPGPRAAAS
jgi:Predicted S-adenosylmethionine-dependent methyltransferase